MKTTRQYQKVCESCYGSGYISETGLSSSSTKTCPACHGSGAVIVTEITEDDWLEQIGKLTPKSIL